MAKQADPDGLVTYANFPPTEYLDLPFLDFATFNVYLHDREAFRRYLFRLQNLVGDKPLLLGELGMDTLRHGEPEQAEFLAGHLREATLMGLAGAFVFSWTDDWHTGGHPIEDWAFGITRADRSPKAAYHALREVFEPLAGRAAAAAAARLGRRLHLQRRRARSTSACVAAGPGLPRLRSDRRRRRLDGRHARDPAPLPRACGPSTSRTSGLSAARNVGLRAATGAIVAYTDSDCFADPDWLTHLVHQLQRTDAAAVGGPNLTPDDGWLAGCVAASPGPADARPGERPGRRAHSRLQHGLPPRGPGRRSTASTRSTARPATTWTSAGGCSRPATGSPSPRAPSSGTTAARPRGPTCASRPATARPRRLLRFKHPDQFNGRGDGKWRGVAVRRRRCRACGSPSRSSTAAPSGPGCSSASTSRARPTGPCCPSPWSGTWWRLWSRWRGCSGRMLWLTAVAMLVLSFAVAALQAAQARLAPHHDGRISRLSSPASATRSRSSAPGNATAPGSSPTTRPWPAPAAEGSRQTLPLTGRRTDDFWTEQGCERTELLGSIAYMNERGWGKTLDSGWEEWDLEVHCHPWTVLQVCTAQEDHGGRNA